MGNELEGYDREPHGEAKPVEEREEYYGCAHPKSPHPPELTYRLSANVGQQKGNASNVRAYIMWGCAGCEKLWVEFL